jgi:hypothetical protein
MKREFMNKILIGIFIFMSWPGNAWPDYTQELRDQIKELETRMPKSGSLDYFHDMGIIARKADEAELTDLTTEIVKSLLLTRMDEYVKDEINAIDALYETDAYLATGRLETLNRFERYHAPSPEFLTTASGQALDAEMIRFRASAIEALKIGCSMSAITTAVQAIRKSGLFVTDRPQDQKSVDEINRELECCLNWKTNIDIKNEQKFQTDYEEGTLTEEAHLSLEGDRRDKVSAKWAGDWIYYFKGREGQGQGKSTALVTYVKGQETAEVKVAPGKVTSSGRMNFPMTLNGTMETVEMERKGILPRAFIAGREAVDLTGCKEKNSK